MAWLLFNRVVGACIGSCVLPVAWNHSEPYRMAHRIQQGALNVPSPGTFNAEFCQFNLESVRNIYQSDPHLFCGLVGVKSTGKTTALKHLASEEKNCIFLVVNPHRESDLDEVLYARLKDSVVTLPWVFDNIRFNSQRSSRTRIENVFQIVYNQTKEKVTVAIDITVEEKADQSRLLGEVFPFSARLFTTQIKHYVADSEVMRCFLAASEGLLFQDESSREARFRLFLAKELSIDLATKFLQDKGKGKGEEKEEGKGEFDGELLNLFPRQFSQLTAFWASRDRRHFAESEFTREVEKIEGARQLSGSAQFDELLNLALKRPVFIRDYIKCGLLKEEFLRSCVRKNILQLRLDGGYEIQFDVTRRAIESLFQMKKLDGVSPPKPETP